ncbi:hypothetical protein PILCRDRAFT_810513 [Piloderma croceum F 1598]|uniref:Uncharacterized protein n=1 Tax=Piloderma croceum (strain F 1598) TaxID=765440 RepID=A0A0C3G899_PILCF|nr:hypothetical protein PILCRDRAFT_810513 [Piloderma croceum F 1598]
MSDLNTHWVKIPLPHSLSNHDSLPVIGLDLLLLPLDASWVFPGPIDIEKLKVALAKTLHDYPHGAGRLSFDEKNRQWSIKLTNDAVPIITGTTDLIFTEELMATPHPDLVESTPLVLQPTPLLDEPLVKLKLVQWKNGGETSLTLSLHHSLGDGRMATYFMTSLSDYYLGLTPALVPTFEKFLQPPPTLERHLVAETLRLAPQLAMEMPLLSFFASIQASAATASHVRVKFTASQLKAIYAAAELDATTKLTTSDALSGYLVTVLNRIFPVTIDNITNTISYRGIAAAPGYEYTPPPLTSAGNVIIGITPLEKIPASAKNSIGLLASYIRNGVEQSRDPECTRRLAALFDESFTKTILSGCVHNWILPPNRCQINNMLRWPIGTNHFGYEGKTRIYWYNGDAERLFRIWKANPVKRADGTWDNSEGGADVTLTLPHDFKPKFLALIAQDMLTPSLVNLPGLE